MDRVPDSFPHPVAAPAGDHLSPTAAPSAGLPAAVLWDMDGTLIDTEPCWIAAERQLVESFGGTWSQEEAEALIGVALLDAAPVFQGAGVDLEPREIARRLTATVIEMLPTATFQPGALELLAQLTAAGVPSAIVTASYRPMVDAVVALTPPGSFAAVVTGDEVARGKPDPLPYLRAAELLGVDPEHCVAIEDSPPGITAALASGARTLGVPHQLPVPPRPGLSRVASLADVTLADLTLLRAGEVLDRLAGPGAPADADAVR